MMSDKDTETTNESIKKIFELLDEQKMTPERESLEKIIESYNNRIDETVSRVTNLIEVTENLHLKITDVIFTIFGAYSVYCFGIHSDLFGIVLSLSSFILWSLRDKIAGLLNNENSRED